MTFHKNPGAGQSRAATKTAERKQRRPGTANRGLVLLIASTLLYAGIAESTDSWVKRYPEARQQTNVACQQKRLQECMDGLQELLALVDGRPDIRCLLATVEAQLGKQGSPGEPRGLCAFTARFCAVVVLAGIAVGAILASLFGNRAHISSWGEAGGGL